MLCASPEPFVLSVHIYVKVGCLIYLIDSIFVLVMCICKTKLTLFRTNSSKSLMAVVASPSVSGGYPNERFLGAPIPIPQENLRS